MLPANPTSGSSREISRPAHPYSSSRGRTGAPGWPEGLELFSKAIRTGWDSSSSTTIFMRHGACIGARYILLHLIHRAAIRQSASFSKRDSERVANANLKLEQSGMSSRISAPSLPEEQLLSPDRSSCLRNNSGSHSQFDEPAGRWPFPEVPAGYLLCGKFRLLC